MNENEWLSRTELLLGEKKLNKLINSNILIVGLGGVGAYAAEQICRAGVNNITIIDGDYVQESNKNRQLLALSSTQNKSKTEVMADRLKDINPEIIVKKKQIFLDGTNIESLISEDYSFIIDAIDTLSPKIELIKKAIEKNIPIVSSMGSGGKKDPSQIQIVDISKSYGCRLAFTLRKKLHRHGIYEGFNVVFSPEKIEKEAIVLTQNERNKISNVGTISFMPAIFGCFLASVVINEISNQ